MKTQVKTWGNSQGIRLPKELLEKIGVHINDVLEIKVENGDIILSKSFKHKTLEERVEAFGGKMGPYEEFQWGEAFGREKW